MSSMPGILKSEMTRSNFGLFICTGIIEVHGGTIGCRSEGPGKGATFWFTLPAVPTRATPHGNT